MMVFVDLLYLLFYLSISLCGLLYLQNPTNKREIFCDEKLKSIFDGKDRVGFLEIGKLLSSHFVKTD